MTTQPRMLWPISGFYKYRTGQNHLSLCAPSRSRWPLLPGAHFGGGKCRDSVARLPAAAGIHSVARLAQPRSVRV